MKQRAAGIVRVLRIVRVVVVVMIGLVAVALPASTAQAGTHQRQATRCVTTSEQAGTCYTVTRVQERARHVASKILTNTDRPSAVAKCSFPVRPGLLTSNARLDAGGAAAIATAAHRASGELAFTSLPSTSSYATVKLRRGEKVRCGLERNDLRVEVTASHYSGSSVWSERVSASIPSYWMLVLHDA